MASVFPVDNCPSVADTGYMLLVVHKLYCLKYLTDQPTCIHVFSTLNYFHFNHGYLKLYLGIGKIRFV